jgi:hypothetical protein
MTAGGPFLGYSAVMRENPPLMGMMQTHLEPQKQRPDVSDFHLEVLGRSVPLEEKGIPKHCLLPRALP